MKHTIRTTSSHIDIEYQNGNYATLSARNFQYEMIDGAYIFEFDISSNLNLRNKSSNQYEDAKSFLEDFKLLKSICLVDEKIYTKLETSSTTNKPKSYKLRIVNSGVYIAQYLVALKLESNYRICTEVI
jgi:hypothetical protein